MNQGEFVRKFAVAFRNVDQENIIRYIPDSHLIPETEIILSQKEDESTPRFSVGHRMRLLYAPKEIVGDVDLAIRSLLL